MTETHYRKRLEDRIKISLPGCFVLRNPATEYQGIPDFTVFYGQRWAMLEVKISDDAAFQPNQMYYIEWMNDMSFCTVIHPDNEDVVIDNLILFLDERRIQ